MAIVIHAVARLLHRPQRHTCHQTCLGAPLDAIEQLLANLEAKIIEPACGLQRKLQLKKARQVQVEALD